MSIVIEKYIFKNKKPNEINFNMSKYYCNISVKIIDLFHFFCTMSLKSDVYFTLILSTFQD